MKIGAASLCRGLEGSSALGSHAVQVGAEVVEGVLGR